MRPVFDPQKITFHVDTTPTAEKKPSSFQNNDETTILEKDPSNRILSSKIKNLKKIVLS